MVRERGAGTSSPHMSRASLHYRLQHMSTNFRCLHRLYVHMRPPLQGALLGVVVALVLGRPGLAQTTGETVLPRPQRATIDAGGEPFVLRSPVRILVTPNNIRLREIALWLADLLRARTGFAVSVSPVGVAAPPPGSIILEATDATQSHIAGESTDAEAYTLEASAAGLRIRGATAAAVLWGVQTVRQLLPLEFETARGARPSRWTIPALRIEDRPRFAWRGSMIDAARHFLPLADVKRHIDLLSRYKLNVLHWHLTDDQGWRLEIARAPRLTQRGGWRTEATGERTGGFYSRRDIREAVEYARQRGVTIVPEIEMPGHASAALASYPKLGCTNGPRAVPHSWGVFADIYCVGKEETFTFLFGVLDEVVALFPAPFVHVGGDEVPLDRWRSCPECARVMVRESLPDVGALQGWFLRRIGAHLASRGRTLIAWDEGLEAGMPSGGIVQSWRDSSFTRKAAAAGHRVIASPSEWAYFDRSPGELTLAHVAAFEPVPAGWDSTLAKRVLGSEVTLWSEHITSGTNLDLMVLPRLLAFADVVWGARPVAIDDLQRRISGDHVPRLSAMGRAVGPADRALPRLGVAYDSVARALRLRLTGSLPGLSVRATFDRSPPVPSSRALGDGSPLAAQGLVRLQAFIDRDRVMEERRVEIRPHLAVGVPTRVTPAPSPSYPGTGERTLTDGAFGSTDHGDGLWTGWWGPDVEVIADLETARAISTVTMRFLQNARSWIVLPRQVELSWSNDGQQWRAPIVRGHVVPRDVEGARIHAFAFALAPGTRARFVRIVARNAGRLPAGHPGAGEPSWIFADEVMVSTGRRTAR